MSTESRDTRPLQPAALHILLALGRGERHGYALIGDVDPMKVAEGRHLGDPETIHFGLIPRSHRGIVAINELPDLAERIQVAMLNVMEERDIQIRGYVLRLPLDVLVVASANPEDSTNRGRIITPLKDRFGAEIRTHYPLEVEDEIADLEHGVGRRQCAAQRSPKTREQLVHAERLCHVVVGTRVERRDLLLLVAHHREDEDRRATPATELPRDLGPVAVG